jgi:dipeptidyl aminopeptidase/acylaminoacyl peptidase
MSVRRGPALVIAIGLLLGASGARAGEAEEPEPPLGPMPSVRWHTMYTPHFRIHFYDDERKLADHAAIIAERAYRLITRYLNWQPSGRVNITLNDQTDVTNGFASSVPFNFIYGYGAPPGAIDELDDFDDYIKLLITHEFTHVVHLDTIIGCPRLIDGVLGKLYAPNLSQPNWFIEGLAVLMESRQTTGGRLRSTFFDMHLRVPFLEGRPLGIDSVSAGPLEFPQGTAAYLYGSNLLKFIEDRYGPDSLREISHRYGSHCVPGGINRTAAEVVGVGYDHLWDDWRRSTAHRYALQADEARRRGLTVSERVTQDGPGPRGSGPAPRFMRDGALVYERSNNDQAPAYVRIDPATGARRVLAEEHAAGPFAPTPDGRALIFTQTNFIPLPWRVSGSSHAAWNDLFRLDIETGDVRAVTHGRRAQEPDVSPDGARIACVVGPTGARQLAIIDPIDGEPRVVADDIPGFAYTPSWSPDGRLIAYSRWTPGGFRDIHLYDVAARTDRALWVDRAMDVDPRFSPDGRYLVFSSDRTGIYNVYAYELDGGRLYQVTNVLSGAFQPALSPDGKRLVYTGFTPEGFDLYETAFDPATFLPAQPFANTRLDAPPDPSSEADSPDASPGDAAAAAAPTVERIGSYQPWKYMYPHTWNFQFYSTDVDPVGLGVAGRVTTTLADPVGNHSVGVDLLVPGSGDPSLALSYTYAGLWPSLSLSLTRSATKAYDLVVDGSATGYLQHAISASAFMGLPVLRRPESSADVSFGYAYTAYGPADPLPIADPTQGITVPPQIGPDADLFVTWSFANAHAWAYSISAQEGRKLQLSLQLSEPVLGGRFHTTEVTWAWTEYLTPPWARLHALALLYSGGVGIGDKRAVFALGGFVEQDLVRSVFLNRRQCCLFLRGYAPFSVVGDQFHLLSAEYRAPLVWIERGYGTFPVYLRRIYGSLFADAGNAFYGSFRASDVKYGVGGELHFQLSLAYYLESELQLGYAKGLSEGGSSQLYFVTSFPF